MKRTYIKTVSEEDFIMLSLQNKKCSGYLAPLDLTNRTPNIVIRGCYIDDVADHYVNISIIDIFIFKKRYYVLTNKSQLLQIKSHNLDDPFMFPLRIRKRLDEIDNNE